MANSFRRNNHHKIFPIQGIFLARALVVALLLAGCSDDGAPRVIEATLISEYSADGANYPSVSSGGAFYGLSSNNRPGHGLLFKVVPGVPPETLFTFSFTDGAVSAPNAGLIEGSDGKLYGTTQCGGQHSLGCSGGEDPPEAPGGTIFSITKDGQHTLLYELGSDVAVQFLAFRLVEKEPGVFYGIAINDRAGSYEGATLSYIYSITSDGTFTKVVEFPSSQTPSHSLSLGPDGLLYGVTNGHYGQQQPGMVYRLTNSMDIEQLVELPYGGGVLEGSAIVHAANGSLLFSARHSYYNFEEGRGDGHQASYQLMPDGDLRELSARDENGQTIFGYREVVPAANGQLYVLADDVIYEFILDDSSFIEVGNLNLGDAVDHIGGLHTHPVSGLYGTGFRKSEDGEITIVLFHVEP